MYRVTIESQCEHSRGAWRAAEDLPFAVYGAVDGSSTCTMQSFILGMIAVAVIEEVFEEPVGRALRGILTTIERPANIRDLIRLALDEKIPAQPYPQSGPRVQH